MTFSMFIFYSFFMSLMGIASGLQAEQSLVELTLSTAHDTIYTKIEEQFQDQYFVQSVTFESDVYMQQSEFDYLTGLHDDMLIDAEILKKSVSYLVKKKKFETIILQLITENNVQRLHIQLIGFWTFNHLKLHGIMLGKDAYRQYYLLEPGEPFDDAKHALSIEKMQEVFAQEGYFNSEIASNIDYNKETKSVAVHCTLKPGNHFSIGAVQLTLRNSSALSAQELRHIERAIDKQFLKRIGRSLYSKKMLTKEIRAIKRYLAKRGFVHVPIELNEQVDRNHKQVSIHVTIDLHRKKKFVVTGNHFFSEDQLIDTILLFGEAAQLIPATIIQQELEHLYKKKGFWAVKIQSTEHPDCYTFAINEGPRAVVKSVSLKKVTHESAATLVKKHFGPVLSQKHFDDEYVAKSLESLMAWYVGQGFLDAHVVKHEFLPLAVPNTYELVVTVDEGKRYCVSSVTIDPFPHLVQQGPFLLLKNPHKPVPFAMSVVQEQRRWLIDYFHQQGYIGVSVKPDFHREGTTISIAWTVTTGESQGRFGKTIVMGSSTFPFEFIIRELQYKEGQLWDQGKLKSSLLRLRGLEIFEGIHLYPYDLAQRESEQAIMLKVQKDDPFELRMRGGFAVQQINKQLFTAGLTYRAGGTFIVKNPLNKADQFRIEADFDRSQRAFSMQYKRPWMFNMPIRNLYQVYSNKYQQPGLIGSKKNLYEVSQHGFLMGLLHKHHSSVDTGLNMGLDVIETTIKDTDSGSSNSFVGKLATAINFEPALLDKKIPYAVIEPTFFIDRVDNKIQATQGYVTLLAFKGMFPLNRIGANSYVVRLFVDQSVYIPLKPLVFALRVRFGHIFHRKLNNISPIERFYLGGANSIRSYDTDRCPPLGKFEDDKGCIQYVPQGGKSMANINFEVRFPIYNQFGGVIFQDIGMLSGENVVKDFSKNRVVAGTGFGLRYVTPLGPLRFDFAVKWHKNNPAELGYAWFLALGNAF